MSKLASKVLDYIVPVILGIVVSGGAVFMTMYKDIYVLNSTVESEKRRVTVIEKSQLELQKDVSTIKSDTSYVRGVLETMVLQKKNLD